MELGCESRHTIWRQLWHWQEAGLWAKSRQAVLEELSEEQILDWSFS